MQDRSLHFVRLDELRSGDLFVFGEMGILGPPYIYIATLKFGQNDEHWFLSPAGHPLHLGWGGHSTTVIARCSETLG